MSFYIKKTFCDTLFADSVTIKNCLFCSLKYCDVNDFIYQNNLTLYPIGFGHFNISEKSYNRESCVFLHKSIDNKLIKD